MKDSTKTYLAITGIVLFIIAGILITATNKATVGDVTNEPYSIKQTSYSPFGAGTWVYYEKDGTEQPLNCTRVFALNCENENKTVIFTATADSKSQTILFPRITINGEEHKIICARDFFSTSCRTTLN